MAREAAAVVVVAVVRGVVGVAAREVAAAAVREEDAVAEPDSGREVSVSAPRAVKRYLTNRESRAWKSSARPR